MKGENLKQEIDNIIKFLEKKLNEMNLYIKNNESLNELSLIIKKSLILLKDKSKIAVGISSEYIKNVYCDIQSYVNNNTFLCENKKNIKLSAFCIVGGVFTFLISYNGDIFRANVEAQNSVERIYISDSSDLKFPTLSASGQLFATDGKVVEEKLNSYDFYNNGEKVVYLTFDDGPTKYTKDILDVLKKYNIRGTFFTTGTALESANDEVKNTLKESYLYGNSIGNHTYSHDYSKLYPNSSLNLKAFQNDLDRNLSLLRSALGESFNTNIIRCPGGSMSWNNMNQLDKYLEDSNKASIDWNALTGDSSNRNNNVEKMIDNAIETSKDKNLVVLLMHETNKNTAEYLDDIIKYYHNNGYTFKTLA